LNCNQTGHIIGAGLVRRHVGMGFTLVVPIAFGLIAIGQRI
jgi:hypothetical protein